ncbi:hypothetical protein Adt_11129 [Abeliophyllum distichum]|uniref:Uncharacterized protein n=1 Tax=Abeliophyllum distichum TaxID=126358 RepID=A0ABD1UM58_9LAMI
MLELVSDEAHIGKGELPVPDDTLALHDPMAELVSDEAHIGKGELPVLEDKLPLRKSSRVICSLWRYDLLITSIILLIKEDEHTTFAELKSSIVLNRWQEAMESEINSIYKNKV